MPRKKLILIDGHSLAYRAFYALPLYDQRGKASFSTSKGEHTNAVYGFANTLIKTWNEEKPDYIAVAFDTGRTFRDDRYADYKATRAKMPDELTPQIERIVQLVEAFGIPAVTAEGYEADDILGTLARRAAADGLDVLIVTGDTDAFQLIDKRVRVLTSGRAYSDTTIYDEAAIKERYGLKPIQLIDFKALKGDTSDNIPGVKGIGEKTATDLLQKHGTLENIYKKLARVEPARAQTALEAGRDMAFLSKDLVTIRVDVPIQLTWEDCAIRAYDRRKVEALFDVLEFRSIRNRLPEGGTSPVEATLGRRPPVAGQQMSMFDVATTAGSRPSPAVKRPGNTRTTSVQDEAALQSLISNLQKARIISFDTEATSTDPLRASLVGIALAVKEGEGYYIPVGHTQFTNNQLPLQIPLQKVIQSLKPILENSNLPKVAHNAKYDMAVLRQAGLNVQGVTFDTMLAEFLIDPSARLGLKALAKSRLGVEMTEITELIGTGKKQITMDQVPIEDVAPYAAADVDMTLRLMKAQEPELKKLGVRKLFHEVEMPLLPVLLEMELAGVLIDTRLFKRISDRLAKRLAAIEKEVYEMVGMPFNINSPGQLADALFGKLQLKAPGGRKTATGKVSVAADVLESMRGLHPSIDLILEHRQLSKLKGTYLDALPELVNPKTGRVHTSFNQTGAVSGRIACMPAGTLVNTQKGLVGIETVQAGDMIRTPFGPQQVLQCWEAGLKPTLQLNLSNGIVLQCSPEHRLRSRGEWKMASELQPGDPVYLSHAPGLFGDQVSLDTTRAAAYPTRKTPVLPNQWSIPLAELVGYLIADGHIARSNYNQKPAKVIWAFGWDDEDLVVYFEKHIRDLFGKTPTHRITRTCPVLELSGVDIGHFFEQLGASGKSAEIIVPPSLFQAPEPIVSGFLRGYFEGDGCVSQQISVRSVSRRFLEQLQQLLTLFGISTSLTGGSPDPRGYAPRHTLRIVGETSKHAFLKRIGFLSLRKQTACEKLVSHTNASRGKIGLITLPQFFDYDLLKPALYIAHRGANRQIPSSLRFFSYRLSHRSVPALTLTRAQGLLSQPWVETVGNPSADFLQEIVAGQYSELKITSIENKPFVPMYDLSVEEVEQYMAQGIVVHNSSDPNLQNIPIRTELGREVRKGFVVPDGWKLIAADYSQVELRIVAHICRDPGLRAAFKANQDIHRATAAKVLGIPPEKVTDDQRSFAKRVNFGLLYGMGTQSLAQQAGISMKEAQKFVDAYFAGFPNVKKYIDETKRKAKDDGYVETLLGRRRYFPILGTRTTDARTNIMQRTAEREAINHPVQGSAADILKIAMIRIHAALKQKKYKARLLLQVHDELLLEAPDSEVKAVSKLVKEIMEDAYPLDPPLKVDVGVGLNWDEVK